MANLDQNTQPDNMPEYGEPREGGNIDTSMEAARQSTQADANNLGADSGPGADLPLGEGEAAVNRGNVMGDPNTQGTNNDITGEAAAYGTPSGANRPASTIGEHHTGVPSATDPETELLDPGYTPKIGSGTERGAAGEQGTSGSPGRPGIPNQAGSLDQTTYTNQDDTRGPDTGMSRGGGLG